MNLRILKKLSKRAAPMILALYPERQYQHYVSEPGEGICDVHVTDRKHWSRNSSTHGESSDGTIKIQPACRRGTQFPFIAMTQPWSPWPGTPMIGWMSGYYEPEWEERSAWSMLFDYVHSSCIDFVPDGTVDDVFGDPNMKMVPTRKIKNPAAILRLARTFIEESRNG